MLLEGSWAGRAGPRGLRGGRGAGAAEAGLQHLAGLLGAGPAPAALKAPGGPDAAPAGAAGAPRGLGGAARGPQQLLAAVGAQCGLRGLPAAAGLRLQEGADLDFMAITANYSLQMPISVRPVGRTLAPWRPWQDAELLLHCEALADLKLSLAWSEEVERRPKPPLPRQIRLERSRSRDSRRPKEPKEPARQWPEEIMSFPEETPKAGDGGFF